MVSKLVRALWVASAAATLLALPARAELVTNGGFGSGPDGWQFVTNAFVESNGGYAVPAGDPAAALGSSGNAVGRIQQTLATVAGQTYDLAFTYWGYNPYAGGKTLDLSIDVLGTATLLQELRSNAGYVTPAAPSGFFQVNYSFVADGASALLRFSHANTDTIALIDDVSVVARMSQPVPEPGSLALAMGALGLLGATVRRGQRRGAA